MAEDGSSETRQELARAFTVREGDARHEALRKFVSSRPDYGEGHLQLGLSYLLNRFSSTLELPMSVVLLGGARSVPTHAPPAMVAEHREKAEEHFDRAMELDPELTVPATSNIAALRLAAGEWTEAIAYIEALMKEGGRAEEPILRQHLGIACRESGDHERAIELFQSILDSEATLAGRNLALTYLCLDDPARADSEMREQLARHDSERDRMLARAIASEVQGEREAARALYLELADVCRYDGQNELLGVNARRRAAKLAA